MIPRKVTIVTGPIVGLKSTALINETTEFAKSVCEKVVVFNLFSEIIDLSPSALREFIIKNAS
jgi:hypothetical protein